MFVFTLALTYVNRSKINTVRYYLATRLRRKTLLKLKAILPILSTSFNAQDEALFPLFRLRADLEGLCAKAGILYDVEHLALANFLTELSSVTAKFKAGLGTAEQIESLILSCQRAINELSEFER